MTVPSKSLERELGTANSGSMYGYALDIAEQTPELRWPINVWVYDRMRRQDAQAGATLRAVGLPIIGAKWSLDPNGARDEVVQHVSEDLGLRILGQDEDTQTGRRRDRFSWIEHVKNALLMLPYGFMPFEQVYRIDGEGAGARVRLRKLAPRMPASIEEIEVNDGGGLAAMYQAGPGRGVRMGVERLVVYVNDREGANWTGVSLLRGAYKHWLMKDRLIRVGGMTIERNGMGVPVVTPPAGAIASDIEMAQRLASAWRAGEQSGVGLPPGFTLKLQGVEGTLPDALPQIQWHNEEIAKNVLAMFLSLGTTQTGARALGETFVDYFQLAVDAVADQIADTASNHIVEDLVDLNWGEDEPAPRIVVAPTQAETDLTPDQLVALVTGQVLTPDSTLEQFMRDRYQLPKAEVGAARPPLSVVASRGRRPFGVPVRAAEGVPATDLPEPLGTIYQRRLDLEQAQNALLAPALIEWADATDLEAVADAANIVKAETVQPVGPDPLVTAAETAAVEALTKALDSTSLREVAHDSLVQAYAEGQAGAGQLVSVTTGQVGIDLETMTVAFDDAVAAAANLDELWAATDQWIADHVGVVSRAMGDAVQSALEDGLTRKALLTDLRAVVENANDAAVLYDHAMATALDQGALDLYASEGLTEVDVLTAGDSRVDDICQTLEADGPYALKDAPSLPAHISCRCASMPADDAIRSLLHA